MEWKVINRTKEGKIIKDLSKVVLPDDLQQFLNDAFSPENLKREVLADEEIRKKIS
ncbi:hypothetical protein [Jeotgalibaca porci]|uniref:hypothetical protein n=1 Tax=Jeotgalibaca porci TaxID=1868793 RepID=UPI00359FF2A0